MDHSDTENQLVELRWYAEEDNRSAGQKQKNSTGHGELRSATRRNTLRPTSGVSNYRVQPTVGKTSPKLE
jgi:hypothetical protein